MKNLVERFEAKFTRGPVAECWLWQGSIAPNGYGKLGGGTSQLSAHRVAYELANGPIPEGLYICHTCDVRNCVNPAHLFAGTCSDNLRDCVSKGRHNWQRPDRAQTRGENHATAKLSDAQVSEIRRLASLGAGQSELARKFGVTQPHVGRLINRKRRPI